MNALGRWVGRQFTTRTIVLIPVAIAINISLGYTTQSVLKLPIYLDSIGTILVGVLCGPLPGALTGLLSNLIWQYSPGIGAGANIGPFAGSAAIIGLLAGLWGYLGVFRARPGSLLRLAIPTGIAIAIIALVAWRIYTSPAYTDPNIGNYPAWVYGAIVAIGIMAALGVAAFVFIRRDASGAWVALAGAATGVVAALASAPVAAYVYGGVTGSGTDLLVAALRQGGSDVYHATLGQGLISDPIDKTITSFVVLVVLAQFSGRFLARFPLGDRLVPGGIKADKQAIEKS
jgi:energy-coupling factor transport system substrate-specific component